MNPSSYVDCGFNIFVSTCSLQGEGYVNKIKDGLKKIEASPTGKRLLDKIALTGRSVFISYTPKHNECNPLNLEGSSDRFGSDSLIFLSDRNIAFLSARDERTTYPFFMILVHELIHAYHFARGKSRIGQPMSFFSPFTTCPEEYATIVGFPSKKRGRTHSKLTENAIASELGLPLRYAHYPLAKFLKDPTRRSEHRVYALATTVNRATNFASFEPEIDKVNRASPPRPVSVVYPLTREQLLRWLNGKAEPNRP